MVYTSNVPLANQTIAETQPIINQNFQDIATYVAVNHEAFNGANQGKHKFIQSVSQAGDPTTSGTEGGIYTKTANSRVNPHYKFQSGTGAGTWDGVVCPLLPVKAFARFPVGGSAMAPTGSFNVASVVGSGGVYTVTLTNPMANTDYVVIAVGKAPVSGNGQFTGVSITNTTTFVIRSMDTNGGQQEAGPYMFVVLGD